jgi:dTMP kinase
MRRRTYGGVTPPGFDDRPMAGRLVVLEGTDGVGRSTQVTLLTEWLESQGLAVLSTGLTRSTLVGPGLKAAKAGHTIGPLTMHLFYATDFADRLQQTILPALRAGYVVLTDRYIYTLMARAIVRGADPAWIRGVYGFALVPDCVCYLQADLDHLVPRVLNGRGFDYWESGMDLLPGADRFSCYVTYQQRLLHEFERMAAEYGFAIIDANQAIEPIFAALKARLEPVVAGLWPVHDATLSPGGADGAPGA